MLHEGRQDLLEGPTNTQREREILLIGRFTKREPIGHCSPATVSESARTRENLFPRHVLAGTAAAFHLCVPARGHVVFSHLEKEVVPSLIGSLQGSQSPDDIGVDRDRCEGVGRHTLPSMTVNYNTHAVASVLNSRAYPLHGGRVSPLTMHVGWRYCSQIGGPPPLLQGTAMAYSPRR